MPEQITKFPDVTLKILKEAGGRCGEGVEQKILKKCPPENFCAFPTGEICVYGIAEIPQMTQVTTSELAPIVCPGAATARTGDTQGADSNAAAGSTLLIGLAIAGWLRFAKGRK